jgi:single-stranded-DNA-specific exonuclease
LVEPKYIANKFELDMITAKILHSRGFRRVKDIEQFINLITEHISWNNSIMIYGDYDVDGVTSSTVLYKTLKKEDADVEVYISDRFVDGYGLSKNAIDYANNQGKSLIITVDCGIDNHNEIDYAHEKGMDVVVIDHHEGDFGPDCPFVDLKVENSDYPFTQLSGCGITWKVCQHMTKQELYYLLDIVAFSTVADVVPLIDENRAIVNKGIKKINNTYN